jgi:hypothetical protein
VALTYKFNIAKKKHASYIVRKIAKGFENCKKKDNRGPAGDLKVRIRDCREAKRCGLAYRNLDLPHVCGMQSGRSTTEPQAPKVYLT